MRRQRKIFSRLLQRHSATNPKLKDNSGQGRDTGSRTVTVTSLLDSDDIDFASVMKRVDDADVAHDPRVVELGRQFIIDEARAASWSDHDPAKVQTPVVATAMQGLRARRRQR